MILLGDLKYPENQEKLEGYTYYWRIVIGRRDLKGPLFEVAGFMSEKAADSFMNKLIQETPEWDNDKLYVTKLMYALAPYYISDADLLSSKIEHLKNYTETE